MVSPLRNLWRVNEVFLKFAVVFDFMGVVFRLPEALEKMRSEGRSEGYPGKGYFAPGCARGTGLDETPVVLSRCRRPRRRPPSGRGPYGARLRRALVIFACVHQELCAPSILYTEIHALLFGHNLGVELPHFASSLSSQFTDSLSPHLAMFHLLRL